MEVRRRVGRLRKRWQEEVAELREIFWGFAVGKERPWIETAEGGRPGPEACCRRRRRNFFAN